MKEARPKSCKTYAFIYMIFLKRQTYEVEEYVYWFPKWGEADYGRQIKTKLSCGVMGVFCEAYYSINVQLHAFPKSVELTYTTVTEFNLM